MKPRRGRPLAPPRGTVRPSQPTGPTPSGTASLAGRNAADRGRGDRNTRQALERLRSLAHPLKVVYGLGFAAMLLPLGLEGDRSVRRHPWVSYAIVLLCFAGFQYQLIAEPGPQWETVHQESWEAVEDFLREHPCRPAPRDLTDIRRSPDVRELLEERARTCKENGPRRAYSLSQPELDDLVAEHRTIERTHPVWRFCDRAVDGAGGLSIVTAIFLHAGWFHLIGNLLFFYVVGPFVEDVYGRPSFAALYLLSGVAGSLAQHYHDPGSTLFGLGASGAISGLMGAFLVRFTKRRIRLMSVVSLWMPFLHYRFSLPAYVILVFWFLRDVAGAMRGYTGIAWWAHIGGFLFGVAFALVFRWKRVEETHVAPGVEREIAYHVHPSLERAIEMRVQGRYRAARRGVELALAAQPDDLDAWHERYEIALAEGQLAEASLPATRLVRLYIDADELQLAAQLTEDALDRIGPDLPPRFYLVVGAHMESAGETPLAGLLYECLRNRHPHDSAVPVTLIREARGLERSGAGEDALQKYEAALEHSGCSAALREAAEQARVRLQPVLPAQPPRARPPSPARAQPAEMRA